MKAPCPIFVASRVPGHSRLAKAGAFCGQSLSSFKFQVSSLALLLAFGTAAGAQTWLLDGRKYTPPDTSGTNTVYNTTAAVARWIALTNGIALEVHSPTGWVRQVEYTED